MENINTSKLVDLVAKNGFTKKDSKFFIEQIFAVIREELMKGNKVKINDFGIFEPKTRAARSGRNPKSGEKITIPEKKIISFTVSKLFKEDMNS